MLGPSFSSVFPIGRQMASILPLASLRTLAAIAGGITTIRAHAMASLAKIELHALMGRRETEAFIETACIRPRLVSG